VFQLFALSQVPGVSAGPGRASLARAMQGHVLAAGMLVGTYPRGEPASSSIAGSVGVSPAVS
jgi:phosphatidylethanolamine-binding protein (PEBP) family uncharacterized protein